MDGKIGEIILPGFANAYNLGNLMVFFQQLQNLRNALEIDKPLQPLYQELRDSFKTMPMIDNVQYLCTAQKPFEEIVQNVLEQQRGLLDENYKDIKTLLTTQLLRSLPEEGHTILCPVNEGGGHWCFMTIFNNNREILYSYNDTAGKPMPGVLREVVESQAIKNNAALLGKTTKVIDYQRPMHISCGNPCGIGAIISGYILSKNPLNPDLAFGNIDESQSHFYRIFHVMTDGALWSNYQTLEEKIALLHIIDQTHSHNLGHDLLIGATQSMFKYLEPNKQCDPTTLNQLSQTLAYKFATDKWETNSYGRDFLKLLEDAEKQEEAIVIKKYDLGKGYEMQLYQDGKSSLTFNGQKCELIVEEKANEKTAEEMTGQIYENPHTHQEVGVLWMEDTPSLSQAGALYMLFGHNTTT